MKKLGLIGGTGPESTLVYYKEINRQVNEATGGKQFPEIAIESVNLFKALNLVSEKRYDELESYLLQAAQNLQNGGADIIALTAGTMHLVYDRLKSKIAKPFISIPQTVAEYAVECGYKRLGLLGTIFTMENTFLTKPFTDCGIEVFVPEEADRITINQIIGGELEYGIVKEESRQKLISEIKKMKQNWRIDGIILGCTELPLALNSQNCPVACLDIMEIHIRKLVQMLVEDKTKS